MKIMITGATGSLGQELIRILCDDTIISYSRSESKQALLSRKVIKYIGDVRDAKALDDAIKYSCPDVIIHAAALKRIDDLELYPFECVKTNLQGSINLIDSCVNHGVKKCILISTDKACKPINVYGASKFLGERLFTNAALLYDSSKFCSCRYGNVIASTGSFIPLWLDKIKNGEDIPVTDPYCTRFMFSLNEAATFVYDCLMRSEGGEVFVPKLPSYSIVDIIGALENILGKKAKVKVIGLRPGEKIHEDMLNEDELPYTYIENNKLVILPQYGALDYTYSEKYTGQPLNSELHICGNTQVVEEKIRQFLGVK